MTRKDIKITKKHFLNCDCSIFRSRDISGLRCPKFDFLKMAVTEIFLDSLETLLSCNNSDKDNKDIYAHF